MTTTTTTTTDTPRELNLVDQALQLADLEHYRRAGWQAFDFEAPCFDCAELSEDDRFGEDVPARAMVDAGDHYLELAAACCSHGHELDLDDVRELYVDAERQDLASMLDQAADWQLEEARYEADLEDHGDALREDLRAGRR